MAALLDQLRAYVDGQLERYCVPLSRLPAVCFATGTDRLRFETADVKELLCRFAAPRIALIDSLYDDFPGLLGQAATNHLGATLYALHEHMFREYLALRQRLLPTLRGFLSLTPVQSLSLMGVFHALLRVGLLYRRYRADAAGEIGNAERTAGEFDYVRDVTAVQLQLSVEPMGSYSLQTFYQTLQTFLKAVHRTGAVPTIRPYWDALLDTYCVLLERSDRNHPAPTTTTSPATPLPPVVADRQAVQQLLSNWGFAPNAVDDGDAIPTTTTSQSIYNAELLSEPLEEESDVGMRSLACPLPFTHHDRRLRLYCLQLVESTYFHQEQRLRAVEAFAQATHAVWSARFLDRLRQLSYLDAIQTFLFDTMAKQTDSIIDRNITEELWQATAPAYLMLGEVERFVLGERDAALKENASLGTAEVSSSDVSHNPHAEQVISALRGEDYAHVRYLSMQAPSALIQRDYLPLERLANGQRIAVAPPLEPRAILFLLKALTTYMAGRCCPMEQTPDLCCWLEELHNGGFGADANSRDDAPLAIDELLAPATPEEAYARYGQTTGAAIVRLMRRTFIVTRQGKRAVRTVEVPSFYSGVLVWLACARSSSFIPPSLDAIVQQLRRQ